MSKIRWAVTWGRERGRDALLGVLEKSVILTGVTALQMCSYTKPEPITPLKYVWFTVL